MMPTAASGLVILLSVQVIQGQDDWGVTYTSTKICAVKGSTVELKCSYRYPSEIDGSVTTVQETIWFTKLSDKEPVDLRADPDYAGRVQYSCNENKTCTLRITDLRESDSAVYKFRFITNQQDKGYTGSPGVNLSVTAGSTDPALRVNVQVSRYSTWTTLKCQSSCVLPANPSYVWYENGQKTQAKGSSYPDYVSYPDSYACAVEGLEEFPSPSKCVNDEYCNMVTYTERRIFALKGSSVDIYCNYKIYGYVTSKFWFSPDRSLQDLKKDPRYAGRVHVFESTSGRSTLRISDLRVSDSSQYHFKFKTSSFEWISSLPGTTLTVTDPDLQIQVISSTFTQSGTSVELICSSSCQLPAGSSYKWFNNGQQIPQRAASTYTVQFEPGNNIYCALNGHESTPSPSVYAPKLPSVSVSPSAEIVEGNSVTLTCSSDANPAASYTWYKENDHNPHSNKPQLVLSSIQSSDSGQYYCEAENKLGKRTSEYVSFDVKYAPKLPSVSVSPSAEIVEGSSVTLTCSSDANPAASYTWYKENQIVFQGPEGIHLFTSITSEDRGIYSCKCENQYGHINTNALPIDVIYAPKLPSVSVSPSAEIVEGSSVTLTCSSDANPAAYYTWYKENDRNPRSNKPQLVFSSIRSSDSGQYYCEAENKLGKTTSSHVSNDVKYPPKLPSVSVSPSAEIVEGSSVTLICSSDANPAASYTWYKENQTLPLGLERSYSFTSISTEDRGNYYCKPENQYGQITSKFLFIDVQYAPKLPSVSVSPSAQIKENSSVTLTCSSDANPAASYTWYKENQTLPLGLEGSYSFISISSEDRGNYYCKSENQYGQINSTSLFVDVQYAPKLPSVSVSPTAEIVEGSSVTLTCSSDANPAASYTWYKENQIVFQGPEGIHLFTSITSEDRGIYSCKSENQYGHINTNALPIDVIYAPKLPSVSVSPSGAIKENSSVTLTCSSDANPAANYTWYKENEDSPKASGQIFTITDFRSEHSGNYYCEAWNKRGRHNSTVYMIAVAGKSLMIVNTTRLTLVAVMLIPLLIFCVWKRKKKIQRSIPEPHEQVEMIKLQPGDDNVYASAFDSFTDSQGEEAQEHERHV